MERMTRRRILRAAGAGAAAWLVDWATLRRTAAQQRRLLSIGTGPTGGVYYPLGGGIAALISKYIAGVSATAETTPGGVDNLKLLHADKVALALSGRVWWWNLPDLIPMHRLDRMTEIVPLADVPDLAPRILNGEIRGRTVVEVGDQRTNEG